MNYYTHIKYVFLILLTASILSIGYYMYKQKEQNKNSITIGFAGDVMLGRLVNEVITQKGCIWPWGDLLPMLHSTDLNIINLETTLTTATQKAPKAFNFKADPDKVQSLSQARIDVVNLANNHIKDFGDKGLMQTISVLDNAKIKHVGAGSNSQEAMRPVIITKNDIKIGILGATDNEPDWQAGANKPGTFYFSVENIEYLLAAIGQLKKQTDIVIISLHWGPNLRQKPSQPFIEAAHAMIDAGADIIHGHSAHIFQAIEIYNGKVIMFDTGDFVDDYMVHEDVRNDRSFLYILTVDKSGPQKVQLIPVIIKNMQVNQAQEKDYRETVARMKQLSEEFNCIIQNDNTIQIK